VHSGYLPEFLRPRTRCALNVFVGVVQAFLKIPLLHELAPLGNEPPFAAAQGGVLLAFVWIGIVALKRFQPGAAAILGTTAGATPTR
jgi:hypothetical protein